MFEKEIIVDGKDHLLGRLASTVAKQLLNGQRVVVVRCESICKSGSLFRNKVEWMEFLNKSATHNPRKWFVHYRSPARTLWRTIRGMVSHKTPRGAAALGKLKVFDGMPAPYDTSKKQVVTDALRVVRLKNHRAYCKLGDLMAQVGWKKAGLIDTLEEKRRARGKVYQANKEKKAGLKSKALALPEMKDLQAKLATLGY